MRRLPLIPALLLIAPMTMAAPTMYVDDTLTIMMRTGQGDTYRIVRTLTSGTPVEVLEEGEEWARVRSPQGTEGWVRTQYLSPEPVARQKLADAEAAATRARERARQAAEQLEQLREENRTLANTRSELEARNQNLQSRLQELERLAAEPRRLAAENEQLKERIQNLQASVDELSAESARLRDDSQRQWFITGAAVLGGGILLGLILPLFRRRKRSSGWGDL